MKKRDQYPIFVHWYKTLDWILDKCEKMPKSVRFSISSRIATISLDIQEKVIEAIYTAKRNPILNQINLLLEKLRIFFRISFERRYISPNQYSYISEQIETTGRMCGGWMKG